MSVRVIWYQTSKALLRNWRNKKLLKKASCLAQISEIQMIMLVMQVQLPQRALCFRGQVCWPACEILGHTRLSLPTNHQSETAICGSVHYMMFPNLVQDLSSLAKLDVAVVCRDSVRSCCYAARVSHVPPSWNLNAQPLRLTNSNSVFFLSKLRAMESKFTKMSVIHCDTLTVV